MGTTNVYGWHYPEATDPPNGAPQIQQVAEDIEGTVSGIETGKVPFTRIDWVNLTPTGAGVSVRNRLRVMRHATGQVEFQVSITIPTATSADVCVLPDWARINGATYIVPLATNNTGSTKVYMNIASDGAVSLAMSAVTSDSGRFAEGVVTYTP